MKLNRIKSILLNQMGREGWDLACMESFNVGGIGGTQSMLYTFKRELA